VAQYSGCKLQHEDTFLWRPDLRNTARQALLDSRPILPYNAGMIQRMSQRARSEGQVVARPAMAWAGLVYVCLVLVSCASTSGTPREQASNLLSTPELATLHVVSVPDGAAIFLDNVPRGRAPSAFVVLAGRYALRLEKKGYAPHLEELTLQPGHEIVVRVEMRENVPPRIEMGTIPAAIGLGDALEVSASAQDNVGVAGMALLVDGRLVREVSGAFLWHTLDMRALSPGSHTLTVEAHDGENNVARQSAAFEVLAPTITPGATATEQPEATELLSSVTVTVPPSATSPPSAALSPTPAVSPTQAAVPLAESPVSVAWDELLISTYAYQQALYTDSQNAGHPYPLLDPERVGPPELSRYRVLRMRNEYLELTLMPELGGRIYQCRFLPTGQDLFYNNRVIKPTRWGPEDQGWWLAVGGMEFCLPVDEHGYLTAEPWNLELTRHTDGSATAVMAIVERSRNIKAWVDISLRPREAGFRIRTTLHNPGPEAQSLQYWINAMLSPGSHGVGSSLRFYYPASEVVVHSSGDSSLPGAHATMSWPEYGGRDLSAYANWKNWLGFFAPDLSAPFTAVYDQDSQLGLVRVFPSSIARGAKLFGFGLHFGDVGMYTDDGSQYVEMWGGLTPTFWDYALLEPQSTIVWEETWYVISQCGGPALATADAVLSVAQSDDHLDVTVASPGEHRWVLRIVRGEEQVAEEAFAVRPDAPFRIRIQLPAGNPDGRVVVSIEDVATRRVILSHVL